MTKNNKPHLLIVEARFYNDLSDALLDGASSAIADAGATHDVVTVPGSLEIPAAIAFAENGAKDYDGYVALGCVIRGETYHFELVANESCRALTDMTIGWDLAIGNGILTVENSDQAWARARKTESNKGGFAARAALSMITLRENLSS